MRPTANASADFQLNTRSSKARRALRCVLLLSDNFERGLGLMNDAIKRAGLKRETKMES